MDKSFGDDLSDWSESDYDAAIADLLANSPQRRLRCFVKCAICLGIIKKTRMVMGCQHRFCTECIEKSLRLGNHKCPACRMHIPCRRFLRDDLHFDTLVQTFYPDPEKYEDMELGLLHEEKEKETAPNEQIPILNTETSPQKSAARRLRLLGPSIASSSNPQRKLDDGRKRILAALRSQIPPPSKGKEIANSTEVFTGANAIGNQFSKSVEINSVAYEQANNVQQDVQIRPSCLDDEETPLSKAERLMETVVLPMVRPRVAMLTTDLQESTYFCIYRCIVPYLEVLFLFEEKEREMKKMRDDKGKARVSSDSIRNARNTKGDGVKKGKMYKSLAEYERDLRDAENVYRTLGKKAMETKLCGAIKNLNPSFDPATFDLHPLPSNEEEDNYLSFGNQEDNGVKEDGNDDNMEDGDDEGGELIERGEEDADYDMESDDDDDDVESDGDDDMESDYDDEEDDDAPRTPP